MSEVMNALRPAHGKIVVAYDRFAGARWTQRGIEHVGRFGQVESKGGILSFDRYFLRVVVLDDVEFVSIDGERLGCARLGRLGFSIGRLDNSGDLLPEADLLSPIKFDGRNFIVRETGQVLTRCRRLILWPDGRAVAMLHGADARELLEKTTGREASMPAAEVAPSIVAVRQAQDNAGDRLQFDRRMPEYEMI